MTDFLMIAILHRQSWRPNLIM